MIIGLDYDDTYTADLELWDAFCKNARDRGHTVIIVTWRSESPYWDNTHLHELKLLGFVHDIVFAALKAKRGAALDAGYEVDVWIDDNPMAVDHDG